MKKQTPLQGLQFCLCRLPKAYDAVRNESNMDSIEVKKANIWSLAAQCNCLNSPIEIQCSILGNGFHFHCRYVPVPDMGVHISLLYSKMWQFHKANSCQKIIELEKIEIKYLLLIFQSYYFCLDFMHHLGSVCPGMDPYGKRADFAVLTLKNGFGSSSVTHLNGDGAESHCPKTSFSLSVHV